MLFTTLLNAQENIAIGVYQDLKLATSNDNHGNTAPTLDLRVDVSLQGKQFDWYYFEVRPSFEYADLYGGKYVSWQVSGGWVFNKLIIDNLEIGGYLTTGVIHRFGEGFLTYGLTGDISYGKNLKISLLGQYINRPDVNKWGFSGYVGIKYQIR